MPRHTRETIYDRPLAASGAPLGGELLTGSGLAGHVGTAVTAQLNSQGESGLVGTLGWQIIQVPSGNPVTGYARSTTGITEAPAGSGVYYVTFTRPSPAGDYAIVWDDGSQYAEEAFTTTSLPVSAPAPADMCSAWITAADVAAAYDPTAANSAIYADSALAATELLNQLSAGQYPGTCTTTVRPCREPCGCWGGIASWTSTSFVWTGGVWANDCGDTCGCGLLSRIRLADYPVVSVTEVRVDGVLVDPDTYRVDSDRYLVRLNGRAWPACQDLSAPAGTLGSFTITYTFGAEPPTIGILAAKELAYELYLAGSGAPCRLPAATQSVTRQGVTYQTASTLTWTLGKGNSGLAYVDGFLSTANPFGWNHRPHVWSPDRRAVRTIGG